MTAGLKHLAGSKGWRLPGATLVLSGLALVVHLVPGLNLLLEYQREAMVAGHIWRLFSCHWAHFSLDHLSWDLLVFLILGAVCERRSRQRYLATVFASALLVAGCVWLFLPGMTVYRGLSGIDSALFGLLAATLIADAVRRRAVRSLLFSSLFLLLFLMKTMVEYCLGTSVFVSDYGAAVVPVPLAHLVGAAAGMVAGLVRRSTLSFSIDSPLVLGHHSGGMK